MIKRVLITPGEPAGIGPDILIKAIQNEWPCELIAIADPDLLSKRAEQLQLPFTYTLTNLQEIPIVNQKNTIKVYPVSLKNPVIAGQLNKQNSHYVIDTLNIATNYCLTHPECALVTGPVHKAIINAAGISFSGHTEWLAKLAHVTKTVMLFVVQQLKVALVTTHLPLKEVADAITPETLTSVISIVHRELITRFNIANPRIGVCGLNPHAGENGYLGREEIDVITPTLDTLRANGLNLIGPLPADTIFTKELLQQFDVILAMYHDQALPLVKYLGFDSAVNVTLGLPFIRTSVDHGTALDLAGTNKANPGSLIKAIELACKK